MDFVTAYCGPEQQLLGGGSKHRLKKPVRLSDSAQQDETTSACSWKLGVPSYFSVGGPAQSEADRVVGGSPRAETSIFDSSV